MDEDARAAFGDRLRELFTGSALTMLLSVGDRTGLLAAAAQGPATSAGLAERAGLQERYVREWLGAMVTGGIFEYEPTTAQYTLPADHAALLTGETSANAVPTATQLRALAGVLPELERCFADGGGIAHETYARQYDAMGERAGGTWRWIYDERLVDGFFAAVPGLVEKLTAGATVLDLGCGTGHAVSVAARAFPASRFTGLDIDPKLLAHAEAECAGLDNATFAAGDAADLPAEPRYDVIMAVDAVHDQHSPDRVLRNVRSALAPGGVFLMVDTKFSSQLVGNLDNPFATLGYAISLLYCTPSSSAGGGAGLGAMWGVELAQRMLAEAGFGQVQLLDSPRPQNCLFVCRP